MTIAVENADRVEAPRRRVWRVLLAGVALLLVYVGLSFVNDPDGTLSTDVGGKTATLQVMDEWNTASPEVGYWASQWDPEGTFHGLLYTSVIDGHYVNVTTVPALELARPLFAVGGYRAALLWSMLGGVAAAFAARAIAARAGGSKGRAWLAFWLAGLASPVLLYSLDLWEHAPGLALMAWGVMAALDAAATDRMRRSVALLAASGAAFGAAFSMRTEAAAYGFVVVALTCFLLWRRRGFVTGLLAGLGAAAAFVVLAMANAAIEIALLGGTIRSGRAAGTAAVGGGDALVRLKEAFTTTVGLFPGTEPDITIISLVAVVLVGLAVWASVGGRDPRVARLAAVGAGALFLIRAADGLGFMPGLLATAPWGVAALVLVFDRRMTRPGRDAVLLVTAALPVVWLFQYTGGAGPQWGGRYVLTTGLVLAAVGVGASAAVDRWLVVFLSALSIAVAVFGLGTMAERTHEVGRAARTVASLDGPVVSVEGFWLRELGIEYRSDTEWLSVNPRSQLPAAAAILDQAGKGEFTLLWVASSPEGRPPELPGWSVSGSDRREDWLGVDFRLTTYVRDPSG